MYKTITKVTNKLYISGKYPRSDWKLLNDLDIKVVISCGLPRERIKYEELPNNIKEHKYFFGDYDSVEIIPYINDCVELIKNAHTDGYSVLVHCKVGMSRSATLIIGYLMLEYKMSRDNAIKYLENIRSCVKPNNGFHKQLELLQNESI